MEFIELAHFEERRESRLTDEEYRELQCRLIENPAFGPLIKGGGGLRKVRVKVAGKSKRDGPRVIYYWIQDRHRIYFLEIYNKNEQADLTQSQLKELREIVAILKELQTVRVEVKRPRTR